MGGLIQQVVSGGRWRHAPKIPWEPAPEEPPQTADFTVRKPGIAEQDGKLAQLVGVIEAEVIPRLMLAHGPASDIAGVSLEAAPPRSPGAEEVAEFTRIVLAHDARVACAYVEASCARGILLETIFLDLLAPTARRLGELWEADVCDFTEVTVGLCHLQQVLREFSPAFRNSFEHRDHDRRALLLPAPGEQHTFGLYMVAEFFRRAGWDVWSGPAVSIDELVGAVRGEWFAVAGLSVSGTRRLDSLAAGIRALRQASCNKEIGVMVGGRAFVEHPELVTQVGADAMAVDGRQAALHAEYLLSMVASRC